MRSVSSWIMIKWTIMSCLFKDRVSGNLVFTSSWSNIIVIIHHQLFFLVQKNWGRETEKSLAIWGKFGVIYVEVRERTNELYFQKMKNWTRRSVWHSAFHSDQKRSSPKKERKWEGSESMKKNCRILFDTTSQTFGDS